MRQHGGAAGGSLCRFRIGRSDWRRGRTRGFLPLLTRLCLIWRLIRIALRRLILLLLLLLPLLLDSPSFGITSNVYPQGKSMKKNIFLIRKKKTCCCCCCCCVSSHRRSLFDCSPFKV